MAKTMVREYITKPKQYHLYNKETKEAFLSQYAVASTRKSYEDVLSKIGYLENMHSKDLYSFTYNEIKDLFAWYGFKNPAPFKRVKSIVGTYLNWASYKKLINSPVDLSDFIFSAEADENVNQIAKEKQYVKNKEELYMIAERFCINKQDAILFVLPYFGVKGIHKNDEIRNLKVADCDFLNNTIIATRDNGTKRIVQLEARAMNILRMAIDEREYEKNNGRIDTDVTVTTFTIIPTEYVVRYSGYRNNAESKINPQAINQRVEKISKLYDKPYLNLTTILTSGIINSLREIEQKNGKLTTSDYKEIRAKYGLAPNRYHDTMALYNSLK